MGIRGSLPPVGLCLRILGLAFLIVSGLAFYALGCWKAFAFKRGTDLKGLLLLVAIACVLLFVLSQWSSISWLGFRLRISYRASAIIEDCKNLLEKWPVSNKLVTSIGIVYPPDDNPNVATLDSLQDEYSFSDQFGPLIHRQGKRIIVTSKTYPFWALEYSEDSDGPKDFYVDYGRLKVWHRLNEVKRISPRLYLARYDETTQ
jgi:hypothetical protein